MQHLLSLIKYYGDIDLLVQNLGSSDESPQSSLLSQYFAAEMHLLFAHVYSLIEHFWLTPASDCFGSDCFML